MGLRGMGQIYFHLISLSPPLHRKSPVDENLRGFFVSANPVFVAIAKALKRVLRGEVIGIEAI
jgi:hypothetical protein